MYGPHKGRPFGLTMAHHARCTPPRKTNYWSGGGPTMRNLDLRSTVEHSFPKCYKAVLKALLVKRVGSTCYNPLLMELRERLWLHSQYSRISNRGKSCALFRTELQQQRVDAECMQYVDKCVAGCRPAIHPRPKAHTTPPPLTIHVKSRPCAASGPPSRSLALPFEKQNAPCLSI